MSGQFDLGLKTHAAVQLINDLIREIHSDGEHIRMGLFV